MNETYFVTYPGQPERQVSVSEWRAAERAAGFTPRIPGYNATLGFDAQGIKGRIEYASPQMYFDDDPEWSPW